MRWLKGVFGGIIGTATVWLSFYFIFHFDTWPEKIFSVLALIICVTVIGKLLDKFYPH